ncbi:small integral membrane protein 30 [Rhinoraja longicauda]
MSSRGVRWLVAAAALVSLLPGAQALDGGDAAALLLGLAVSTVGLCACLGWYSRRRRQQL